MQTTFDSLILHIYDIVRSVYLRTHGGWPKSLFPSIPKEMDEVVVNREIYDLLMSPDPCLVARFGYVELNCVCEFLAKKYHKYDLLRYARCQINGWWYSEQTFHEMPFNAGFFSPSEVGFDLFSQMMLDAMPHIDILGSWLEKEYCVNEFMPKCHRVDLELLNPLWAYDTIPWTTALEGKNVLVVHPFSETIQRQYENRLFIHRDQRILPPFNLLTLQSVQSIGNQNPMNFNSWFEALDYMKRQIDELDYDICIIGCGAYGLLLADHCKCRGKKAIHLGGATQLLFGIIGRRWEKPGYGFNGQSYVSFKTPYWVRPSVHERPTQYLDIEKGCYW